MGKMKKALMIIIMVAIVIIISLTPGCAIQEQIKATNTREEIIKFDEEYWKIDEEWVQWQKDDSRSDDEVLSDYKKYQKDYSEDILKFKSINIPKPLDEFYYKKIEQFNSIQLSQSKLLQLLNIVTSNTGKTTELDRLLKEAEDYKNKGNELKLEADKIQREVYREYDLDDLIAKWQK